MVDPDETVEFSLVAAEEIPSYLVVIGSLVIFHFGSKFDQFDVEYTLGRGPAWLRVILTALWFILVFISGLATACAGFLGFLHGLPWSIALVYWIYRAKTDDDPPRLNNV